MKEEAGTETTPKVNNTPNPEKPGKSKGKLSTQQVVLTLGSLIIVAAAAIALVMLLQDDEPAQIEVDGRRIITEANVHEIQAEIQEAVERGMFETHMNTTWTFSDGASPSHDAEMGNSSNNHFAFYFTVTLQPTDEVVFTSGLLPVGTAISEITLDRVLPAGTYHAVVNINMIDDDGEPVNANMGINVTLVVES